MGHSRFFTNVRKSAIGLTYHFPSAHRAIIWIITICPIKAFITAATLQLNAVAKKNGACLSKFLSTHKYNLSGKSYKDILRLTLFIILTLFNFLLFWPFLFSFVSILYGL